MAWGEHYSTNQRFTADIQFWYFRKNVRERPNVNLGNKRRFTEQNEITF